MGADKVNYCRKYGYNEFGMYWCAAPLIKDQEKCKYRKKSSVSSRCMYFRKNINRHCDNIDAQKDSTTATAEEKQMKTKSEKERERKEAEESDKKDGKDDKKAEAKKYKDKTMEQVRHMYEKWGNNKP